MLDAYENMAQIIHTQANGKTIFYLPNPGNWGDGLINEGFKYFARHFKISFRQLTEREIQNRLKRRRGECRWVMPRYGGVLIYGGGGAWCHNWPRAKDRAHDGAPLFDRLIVLPSTYELRNVYFDGSKDTYFARDFLESTRNNTNAIFCHDMALFLRFDSIRYKVLKDRDVGYFFRTDKEASGHLTLPPGNRDISREGTWQKEATPFLREVGRFNEVHTDRLHVAIAGCLQGSHVTLYPGNYFKNEAVYRSSLEPFFKGQIRFLHIPSWERSSMRND